MLETVFWLCAALLVYPFVIYPALLALWNRFAGRPVIRNDIKPKVTVVIPAYNESAHIEQTLKNKLEQTYPAELLEIIVVSDESTDGTDDIVKRYLSDRVRLIRQQPRAGKASGLNLAVREARGEIIVFSDANTLFSADAIMCVVKNFDDASVGYVTGAMGFLSADGTVAGEGISAYMRYENRLRALETRFWSIVGSNGGVDAIRKSLYVDIPKDQITDFVLPLQVNAKGFRAVFDASVKAWEFPNTAISSEYKMRVRVALRAIRGMVYMRRLFNPIANVKLAFSLLSHKLLRYLAPFFMLVILVTNVPLANGSIFYMSILAAQVVFFVSSVLGWLRIPLPPFNGIIRLCAYFTITNIAFGIAWMRWMRGEKMAMWKPRGG